jgi:hypothetical protein
MCLWFLLYKIGSRGRDSSAGSLKVTNVATHEVALRYAVWACEASRTLEVHDGILLLLAFCLVELVLAYKSFNFACVFCYNVSDKIKSTKHNGYALFTYCSMNKD